jgi:DNA-binding CsgD family transcriptional regulator
MGRRKHPEPLTPAEQRVLDEIKVGGTNAEIAVRLGLSINTVKYHVSNMLAKLEMDDRVTLAAWKGPANAKWQGWKAVWIGLGAVAASVAAVGLLFALLPRGDERPERAIWWFETKRNVSGSANGFVFREILTGVEHGLKPPPGVQWFAPQWSPDGSRFSALEVPDDSTRRASLRLWTTDGKPVASVPISGLPDGYYWTSDSSRLALVSDELAIVSKDGKPAAHTRLDAPALNGQQFSSGAAWSPDGKAFAFLRNGLLVAVHTDGSSQRLLLTGTGIDSDFTAFAIGQWSSPDTVEVIHRIGRGVYETLEAQVSGNTFELGAASAPATLAVATPFAPDAKGDELQARLPNMVYRGKAQSADGRAAVYQFNKPYPIQGEVRPATIFVVIKGQEFEFQTLSEPDLVPPLLDAGVVVVGDWSQP